jgi:hypothetical protein
MDPEPARCLLVDLRVLEHGVHSFAVTALEHAPRLRAGELEAHSGDAIRAFTLGGGDPEDVAAVGKSDQHQPRVDELPQAPSDEREERLELELRDECIRDLVQRFELA